MAIRTTLTGEEMTAIVIDKARRTLRDSDPSCLAVNIQSLPNRAIDEIEAIESMLRRAAKEVSERAKERSDDG